jgi:transcriptional regulatory protein RtcR
VEVNCATLRGDAALSTLFGHKKGAYTGATADRDGLLLRAHEGLLFLDEVGELGLDEQAMLLRALEEKVFLPMGADREVSSSFQLLCGTHRDLAARVRDGGFREDLLARLDIWSFRLPPLCERKDDIEPNLDVELERASRARGEQVRFTPRARAAFLAFATASQSSWPGNFRELSASMERLATLSAGGRIDVDDVKREVARKQEQWKVAGKRRGSNLGDDVVARVLGAEGADAVDPFDRVQLAYVIEVCAASRSLAEAGRSLFSSSRKQRASKNDSDRVRKYLASYGLSFDDVRDEVPASVL